LLLAGGIIKPQASEAEDVIVFWLVEIVQPKHFIIHGHMELIMSVFIHIEMFASGYHGYYQWPILWNVP
jgi:hypothetical protein